ncbi:MAG: HipA domain-containing protein [Candidatus Homeothermus sp.]|nr:HipA domain-containing protein [Candidatus Homeothermus sp.]
MNKCLFCYKTLSDVEVDYHKACARKIFQSTTVPLLPYTRANIKELAREIVTASTTVTGVQAKLSLDIARGHAGEPKRFTIVGLWGRFILKPQTELYANLPENEDLTMHMAEAAGIKTVPHSLIRFADGELCYITRRVDRTKKGTKIAMEDMCQLSERLTEDKYKGSYERIAKLIRQYSSAPLLDVVNFWEVVLFSWLTGNADMHLKNSSLFRPADNYMLTPAYDLLSTALAMPEDDEELALTLNAKKKRIKREDFEKAMRDSGMDEKAISNMFSRFFNAIPEWHHLIDESFLNDDGKTRYHKKIDEMSIRLFTESKN